MSKTKSLATSVALLVIAQLAYPAEYNVTADAMKTADDSFVFSGAVSIESDDLNLSASELVVEGNIYRITGSPAKLTLYQDNVATIASGNQLTYDSSNQRLEISEGGNLTQDELEVTATSISFDIVAQRLRARGAVRLNSSEITATGDRAVGNARGNGMEVVISGSPAKLDLSGEQSLSASASRIEINQQTRQMVLTGDARAQVDNQSVAGEVIEYDLERNAFAALPGLGGRVRAVISTQ